MKRIDVTKLAPLTRDVLRSWTVASWRDDAYDPAFDDEIAPKRPRPNLVIHPAYTDVVDTAEFHGDLDSWV